MAGTALSDPNTIGQIPSFAFDTAQIMGPALLPVYSGSQQGVPPVDSIAGQTPAGSGASAAEYANVKSGQGAGQQPILWLVILVVLGVMFLGHAARLNVRG